MKEACRSTVWLQVWVHRDQKRISSWADLRKHVYVIILRGNEADIFVARANLFAATYRNAEILFLHVIFGSTSRCQEAVVITVNAIRPEKLGHVVFM